MSGARDSILDALMHLRDDAYDNADLWREASADAIFEAWLTRWTASGTSARLEAGERSLSRS